MAFTSRGEQNCLLPTSISSRNKSPCKNWWKGYSKVKYICKRIRNIGLSDETVVQFDTLMDDIRVSTSSAVWYEWHLSNVWEFIPESKLWLDRKLKEKVAVLDYLDDRLRILTHPKTLDDLAGFLIGSRSKNADQVFEYLTFDLKIG
ncbi:hypothetical protein AAE478_006294 [Parahypoxylon ruwenzoriense]